MALRGDIITDLTFEGIDTRQHVHVIHKYPARMVPQIARFFIKKYSKTGDTIIDPFVGSGTVLVESKILGRNAVGVDINPLAYMISSARIFPLDTTAPE